MIALNDEVRRRLRVLPYQSLSGLDEAYLVVDGRHGADYQRVIRNCFRKLVRSCCSSQALARLPRVTDGLPHVVLRPLPELVRTHWATEVVGFTLVLYVRRGSRHDDSMVPMDRAGRCVPNYCVTRGLDGSSRYSCGSVAMCKRCCLTMLTTAERKRKRNDTHKYNPVRHLTPSNQVRRRPLH